jgi:hypothetical protein
MGKPFTRFGKFFCYYFIEYIMNPFGLHLLSFFNAHDPQLWSFAGVAEFLHILFTALELFKISSVFSLISILSLSSEILFHLY